MRRRTIRLAAATLLALVALAVFAIRTRTVSALPRGRSVTCELSNPAYSGWCRVTEAIPKGGTPAGVCEGVASCLNNPACVVRTYCNATTIRGGWKLESIRVEWRKPAVTRTALP